MPVSCWAWSIRETLKSRPSREWAKSQFGLFAQDTWKVTRKFTLDYGLRYDYSTYPKEQYGRIPTLSPTTPDPSAGDRLGAAIYEANCNCSFAKNYPLAFGPRAGRGLPDHFQDGAASGSGDCLQQHGGQRHPHPLRDLVEPVHVAFLWPACYGPGAGRAVYERRRLHGRTSAPGITRCLGCKAPRSFSIKTPDGRPDSINGASACSARSFAIWWWRPPTWATAGFGGRQPGLVNYNATNPATADRPRT